MSFTQKVLKENKAQIGQKGEDNKKSQKKIEGNMSFTSKVIDDLEEFTIEDKRAKVLEGPLWDYLVEISSSTFESLRFSDIYLCSEFGLRKYNSGKVNKMLDVCNDQIKGVLDILDQINTIEKKDSFDYKRLCDKEYDLKPEEKSFLRDINVSKDELGFGLGSLYTTTKVFLDVSSGKIKETGWNDEDDPLGYYTKKSFEYSGPQIWLIMDRITEAAERLGFDRKYIIAKVYIHEMMHRFYDLRPDLGWKRSVKEIEEPMAEFATLKFIEELSKHNPMFEKLLPIAIVMTEGLRKSEKHFIYALGVDLYYKAPIKLIFDFRRIAMLLHKSSKNDEQLDPLPMKSVDDFVEQCKPDQDLRQLVGDIKKCIEAYAKFFPINKGIR